jgi:hypothetical protein
MQLIKISLLIAALAGFAFAKPVEVKVDDEPGKFYPLIYTMRKLKSHPVVGESSVKPGEDDTSRNKKYDKSYNRKYDKNYNRDYNKKYDNNYNRNYDNRYNRDYNGNYDSVYNNEYNNAYDLIYVPGTITSTVTITSTTTTSSTPPAAATDN